MIARVLVELVARNVDKTFDYIVPKQLEKTIKVGMRVIVDFNNRPLEGFVLSLSNNSEVDDLKTIVDISDEKVILNKEMMKIGYLMKEKTLATLMSCFQAMLPKALKASVKTNVNKKYIKYISLGNNQLDKYNAKQQEIIDMVSRLEQVEKNKLADISLSSVNTLIKHGVLLETLKEEYRTNLEKEEYPRYPLTSDQQIIINEFNEGNQEKPFLLYGVTGSGKTEIYMELIEEEIKNNRSAIVLVPEISLTPQIIKRFSSRFERIAVLHSRLTDGEKYDEWRRIAQGEVDIVIGARSAIFAPLNNLGLIIIDEEHTTTYHQENNPRYHALDIALFRMKYHKAKLLIGSATPKLESMARAKKGVYNLLELTARVNNRELPKIKIIDLSENYRRKSFYFTNELYNAINDRLEKKEQIMLFLNRRGYSTITTCSNCGYTSKCPNCEITLTYHKTSNMLRCHYCSYAEKFSLKCPSCQNEGMNSLGMGTEKLEEEVNKLFPSSKTIRMDYDTTTKKGAHKKIIDSFSDKKYDILIGTQMIAKGLDFPNVTLVGIINADNSLNIPDFRSSEYTYQLLEQVSGRSGRGEKSGEVIIQTFNKDHYAIDLVKYHDYNRFYEQEMLIRKTLKYPPYYYLTLLTISSKEYETASKNATTIAEILRKELNQSVVLGPSVASLFKVKNTYHFQIILKYRTDSKQIEVLKNILKYYNNNVVKTTVTFNPTRLS